MSSLFSNNQPSQNNYSMLKDKDWRLSNLYKITDEFGHLVTFKKNPAQTHFEKNKHTRNIILKSRRLGFCLDPKTKVLTADLQWVPISNLKLGQEVVAVDEFPPGGRGAARQMNTAKVQGVVKVFRKAYRITFNDGRQVICTGQHPWLSKKVMTDARWRAIEKTPNTQGVLKVGTKVRSITKPWNTIPTYEDGWYAGMLDGEGSISKKNHSFQLSCSQRDGSVLDRMVKYVTDRGYFFKIESKWYKNDPTRVPNHKIVIRRLDEAFRIIGQTRASRFIVNKFWEGRGLPGKRSNHASAWVTITNIEELEDREMIDLQTSSGTYIAEGLVSHNTTFSAVDMFDNTLFHQNWNSLFLSYDDQSSKKVFDEIIMLAWLHFPLQQIYKVDLSNANLLKLNFGNNTFSGIEVKSSGRGGRYNHIHVSEFAKICAKYPQKAQEIMTGAVPALTPDGLLTVESTAEGDQGDFHDMYWQAVERSNSNIPLRPHEYKPHFYNWQWDHTRINKITQPDAQIPKQFQDYQKQHNEKAKKLPNLYQPISDIQLTYWFYKYIELNSRWSRLLQEFPTTAEEAFQHSGNKLFDQLKLEKQKNYLKEPVAQVNDWKIYEEPAPNHVYVVGADPSEGVGGDHSAAVVLDFTPKRPRVVATYANNMIPPDMFAYELKTQARAFNYALVMVERNNTGHATLTQLKQIYPPEYIYKEEREQTEQTEQTERLGWHTNMITKPRMFFDLSTAVNEDLIELTSSQLLHEARMYDRSSLQKTKSDPESTNHFDLLTSVAIALQGKTQVAYSSQEIITVLPKQSPSFNPFAGC